MTLDIDKVVLKAGSHRTPSEGLCVMEAVAFFAGEEHSDRPECVSPVIATFLRLWNDALDDGDRQQLKALIPVVVNTRSAAEDEDRRSWMALDWLVREYAPAWLRLANLDEQAARLERLPRFKAGMDVSGVRPVIDAIRADAAAAGDAAWYAAGDAAGAAGAAAGAAARDAARAAAGDAAWYAAWAAAWAAGAAAWAAARDAARAALRSTVVELQASAMGLVERMAHLNETDRDERNEDTPSPSAAPAPMRLGNGGES